MNAFPEIEEEFEAKKLAAKNAAAMKMLGGIAGPVSTPQLKLNTVSRHIAEARAHITKLEYLEELLVLDLPILDRDDALERIRQTRAKY